MGSSWFISSIKLLHELHNPGLFTTDTDNFSVKIVSLAPSLTDTRYRLPRLSNRDIFESVKGFVIPRQWRQVTHLVPESKSAGTRLISYVVCMSCTETLLSAIFQSSSLRIAHAQLYIGLTCPRAMCFMIMISKKNCRSSRSRRGEA